MSVYDEETSYLLMVKRKNALRQCRASLSKFLKMHKVFQLDKQGFYSFLHSIDLNENTLTFDELLSIYELCFPFLIGFIISLLIEPLIRKLANRTGFERKTSAIIVLIVIFTILIGLIIWGVITLITESSNLLESINIYIEKISTFMQNFKIDDINMPTKVVESIASKPPALKSMNVRPIASGEYDISLSPRFCP